MAQERVEGFCFFAHFFAFSLVSGPAGVWALAAVVAAPDAVGGVYCEDCHVAEISEGEGIRGGVRPYALDPERARALWAKSEDMVGETFA